MTCDFIVISAGIRPQTAFLENTGIHRNPNGAVVVNEGLETSQLHIHAIGECATFEGTTFGLVAPGYQMADVLAERLTGVKRAFKKPDLSARLKVMGVHVAALGDYFQSDPIAVALKYSDIIPRTGPCYRKLILLKRRVVGIMVVGPWDTLPAVQQAMEAGIKLSWKQLELFEETGELFKPCGEPAVMKWSDHTQVCNCMMVSKGTLTQAIQNGCTTVEELSTSTLAGTVCGSCKPVLSDLMGAPSLPACIPVSAQLMMGFSILAFFGVGASVFAGPLVYADSVEVYWYKVDQLWRDNLLRQISGYSLLVLCLGALFLSVQKRFQNLKIGNYSAWRAVHTATGVLTLATLFLHTGWNIGANFNSWLMLTFALLNLLGGVSGIFSGLEAKTDSGIGILSRRLKPVATWAHILLFWPIPVLILFHIASVYYW
jgi:nitrite reductase (NADH) large subunit